MKIIRLVIAAFLIGLLASCDGSTGYVKTAVGPTLTVIPIVVETKTAGERMVTATRRPTNKPPILIDETSDAPATPTSTLTPAPPPPTPISEPLNQTGPWLMLSQGTTYSGPRPYLDPVFINADGSGWQLANIPRDPFLPPGEPDASFGTIASNGPYAAFYGYMTEYQPTCPKDGPGFFSLGGSLYILKLPENKVVYEFDMFGEEAKEQFHKDECTFVNQGRFDTPPVMGVTSNQFILHWSPDGRYLAFPAAPEGKAADLYLYDTQTNTVRRLTTRQNNPDILGWSPDGQAIIYRSITRMDLFKLQFLESDGLYSVSVSGDDRLLFTPEVIPIGLEWLSKTEFLITDGLCDAWGSGLCTTHLRKVHLITGTNEVIYTNSKVLIHYVADPIHHLLLISNPTSDMPGLSGIPATPDEYRPDLSFVDGVYQYDFSTGLLKPVLADNVDSLIWDKQLDGFRSFKADQVSPYTNIIRYVPGNGFTVEKVFDLPEPSPDGAWSVGKLGDDWFILDAQNQPVQKLLSKSDCRWASNCWSPDSSAYVELVPNEHMNMTQLIVYQKENNWQPTVKRHILYGKLWSYEWITP